MWGCYILWSEIQVEVHRLAVKFECQSGQLKRGQYEVVWKPTGDQMKLD
jgi:hypothetical protein